MGTNYFWYHEKPEVLNVLVKIKQLINTNLILTNVNAEYQLPHNF